MFECLKTACGFNWSPEHFSFLRYEVSFRPFFQAQECFIESRRDGVIRLPDKNFEQLTELFWVAKRLVCIKDYLLGNMSAEGAYFFLMTNLDCFRWTGFEVNQNLELDGCCIKSKEDFSNSKHCIYLLISSIHR